MGELDYLGVKPPTQPNFNAGKSVACEAVESYCEQATMKPPTHPTLQ